MKPLIICTAILGLAFSCPAAEANKQDANRAEQKTPRSTHPDNRI
jgi:hypothetical protein